MNPSLRRTLLLAVQIAAIGSFLSQASVGDFQDLSSAPNPNASPRRYTAWELVKLFNDENKGRVTFEVDWDHPEKDAPTFRVKAKLQGSKRSFPIEEPISLNQDPNNPLDSLKALDTRLKNMELDDAVALARAAHDFKKDAEIIAARYQMEFSAFGGKIASKVKGCESSVDFSQQDSTVTTYFPDYKESSNVLYKKGTIKYPLEKKTAQSLWMKLSEQIAQCPQGHTQKALLENARAWLAVDSPDLWSVTCDKNITQNYTAKNPVTWPHTPLTCERLLVRYFEKFDCHLVGETGITCASTAESGNINCRIRPTDRCRPALQQETGVSKMCQDGFFERKMSFPGNTKILFCQKDDKQAQENAARLQGKLHGKTRGEAGTAGAASAPQ